MDLAIEKMKLIDKIIHTDSEELIEWLKEVLTSDEADFWDELPDSTKASVERGIVQANSGKTIPHEQAITKLKKWR
ncbi:MAG: hypothetical protein K1X81_06300 [Bacteroidia bacterium]|nr:hypothetical protein [Bacteroidia bacterium]